MLKELRILGAIGLFLTSTVFHCLLVYFFAVLKLIVPISSLRLSLSKLLARIAESWIDVNNLLWQMTHKVNWVIEMDGEIERNKSYCILANHQSWSDILVLHHVFNRRVPFLRFFIKSDLFWVPFLGFAWWALDFPFMKRYSKEYLQKYPQKKGKDLDVARRCCEKFRQFNTSILIFAEGTRFTTAKHRTLESPYRHLLPAKVGGLTTVLQAMGDQLDCILDVTIYYSNGSGRLMDLVLGKIPEIRVTVKKRQLQADLSSPQYIEDVKAWLNATWQEKDVLLGEMHRQHSAGPL